MDINQIYRAPAIPKLSKRNISSSVLRASSAISSTSPVTPKLRTTRFSFRSPINLSEKLEALKPKPLDAEKILSKKQDTEENTYKALAETNRILVEIQKQLSYDFAMRIAEEKEAVKKIKAAESKRKVAEKEKSVEGAGKKISGIGESIVNKVTAPIKSVFDKIKEFFSLILSGIVLNVAFKWLQDENNQKLLDQIFYWIGKAFIPAVITIIGFKVFKWVKRLFLLGRFLWKLPGNILKFLKGIGIKPRGPSAGQGVTKGLQAATGALTPAQEAAKRKLAQEVSDRGLKSKGAIIGGKYISVTAEESAKLLKKPNILQKGIQAIGGFNDKLKSSLINPIINVVLPKLPPKVKTEIAEAVAKKGLGKFLPYVNILFGTVEGIQRIVSGDIEGALLSFASAIPIAGWGALALDIYRSVDPEGYKKNIRFGMTSGEINQAIGEGFNNLGSAMSTAGFSNGGTVPGKGSGFVDSVKAMLAPGEEVIRTTSSMLFRPLLKDINDNAGRLWVLFTQAIRKLFTVSDYQRDVSEEFSKVIEDFNKYLKEEILKNKAKPSNPNNSGNGGFRVPSVSPKPISQPAPVSAAPRITNISMNVSAGAGGMTFLPMVLPKQSSKPPQIPQMQGKATDVPVISPVNFANPYMEVTPGLYGIQLIV